LSNRKSSARRIAANRPFALQYQRCKWLKPHDLSYPSPLRLGPGLTDSRPERGRMKNSALPSNQACFYELSPRPQKPPPQKSDPHFTRLMGTALVPIGSIRTHHRSDSRDRARRRSVRHDLDSRIAMASQNMKCVSTTSFAFFSARRSCAIRKGRKHSGFSAISSTSTPVKPRKARRTSGSEGPTLQ
jgi:hypothetical protein